MPILNPNRREALDVLSKSPLVKKVSHNYYHIVVKFNDGITENWQINPGRNKNFEYKLPNDDLLKKPINTYCEYEVNPLETEHYEVAKPNFLIHKSDYLTAGFVNLRLKVHEIIRDLLEEGWVDPRFLEETLVEDYEAVKACDINYHIHGTAKMDMYNGGNKRPGAYLSMHFLDWGSLSEPHRITPKEAWTQPKTLLRALDGVIQQKEDITRRSLLRRMCVYGGDRISGPRLIPPSFFIAILKHVFKHVKNPTVLDVNPGLLNIATATAIVEGAYVSHRDLSEFAEFTGQSMLIDNGQRVDIAFLTEARNQEVDEVLEQVDIYQRRADNVVAFVKAEHRDELFNAKRPKRTVITNLSRKPYKVNGYMFVY